MKLYKLDYPHGKATATKNKNFDNIDFLKNGSGVSFQFIKDEDDCCPIGIIIHIPQFDYTDERVFLFNVVYAFSNNITHDLGLRYYLNEEESQNYILKYFIEVK